MMLFKCIYRFWMLPAMLCLTLAASAQDPVKAPRLVKDIYPNLSDGFSDSFLGGSSPNQVVSNGSKVFFNARDSTQGMQLWVSDGTDAGTRKMTNFALPPRPPYKTYVTNLSVDSKGLVYFIVTAGVRGLWVSDGTTAGTRALLNLTSSTTGSISELKVLGSRLLFVANDGSGNALWGTDGTPAGTRPLAPGSKVTLMGEDSNKQFFVVNWSANPELWITDGTPAGTSMIKKLGNEYYAIDPIREAVNKGTLYFSAGGGDFWRSDGTTSGTYVIHKVRPTPYIPPYARSAFLGNTMFFVNDPYFSYQKLWKSDGTPSGTQEVDFNNVIFSPLTMYYLHPFKQKMYIFTYGASSAIYATDGGKPTFVAGNFGDYIDLYRPAFCVSTKDAMIFTGHKTLWRSDGTSIGTVRIGTLSYNEGRTFLQAPGQETWIFGNYTSDLGDELWQTDGTARGTRLMADVYPGSSSAMPQHLAICGDKLFFTARDASHGRELWTVPLSRLQNAVAAWRNYE